jgi:ketosteroid isomerase-like protein
MSDHSPAAVASRYFDALASGDVPTAMALLSPDVVWHQPGSNRFSGDHHSPDGVGALVGGMMEASGGTFQLAVTGPAMVNGAMVAVPVRFTGQREDIAMDMTGIDLLTVTDGAIIAVHLFSEDGPAEDRFWGAA